MTVRTRSGHNIGRGGTYAETRLDFTTDGREDDQLLREFAPYATIAICTGAAWVQTYADADVLRAMARSLLAAAADLDQIAPVVVAREAA
jgi:hypothetical protein